MSVSDPHILAEKRGALGLLTLNRPQALNALTHGMINAIHAVLEDWATDHGVTAVAIRGEGRGFCAGGDIRAVRQMVIEGSDAGLALLRDEYRMNALVGNYPKPYIALLHGITMGGGAGVSVHGRYRLADASLSFAMPETLIGFIPDVGSSHFLARLSGELGMYLALSGARVGLGDALAAGIVTHAVEADNFDAVIAALAHGEDADAVIRRHARKVPAGILAPHVRRIQTLFAAASVEAILERLDRDGSEFARDTAQTIRTMSPTSLKLTYRELREAASLTLKQCLAMEYRLAAHVLPSHDFREGVRAALVDKDRTPKWNPASLAAVERGDIDAAFSGAGRLF